MLYLQDVRAVASSDKRSKIKYETEHLRSVFLPSRIPYSYHIMRGWRQHILSIGLPARCNKTTSYLIYVAQISIQVEHPRVQVEGAFSN